MLKRLDINHFTVFKDAGFEFGPGLNVLIGDNGTGKTHVLKLGYMFCRAWPALMQTKLRLGKQRAESYLEERLAGLFKTGQLTNLISQGHRNGAELSAQVVGRIPMQIGMPSEALEAAGMEEAMAWDIRLRRAPDGGARVDAQALPDSASRNAFVPRSVFIPSKEVVSLFKGLVGLFESFRDFPLDETYRDLAAAMATLEPRQPSLLMTPLVDRIVKLLGGELAMEQGELLFRRLDSTTLESQLLAEGHRKLALLIYLLRHDLIERGGTVFWDEPEANLNPAAIKLLAEALHTLSGHGVQVILATHSLFLLRELEILGDMKRVPAQPAHRYFALGRKGGHVVVSVGDDIAAIDPLVLLDEEIQQSDRFLAAAK